MIYFLIILTLVFIIIYQKKQLNKYEKIDFIKKQEFYDNSDNRIGSIAHQWRQPLMELSSLFIDIESQIDTKKTIEISELSNTIDKTNNILKYMSSTIDDFNNFLNSKRDYKKCTLSKLVDMAIIIVEHTLENKDIQLEVIKNNDAEVYIVENEYIQVLINLISNAKDILIDRKIKNPKITISINKVIIDTVETTNQAVLFVSDNAGGILTEPIDDIFKPYFSKRNFINSTGMGLFMSKAIIENHFGGQLQANNNKYGAVFAISLPLYKL